MKILFLDVDGVLNSARYFREKKRWQGEIDKTKLPYLRKIIEDTDAKIVLSSTWKNLRPDHGKFKQLTKALKKHRMEIYDYTPNAQPGDRRINEIKRWLKEHEEDVESFVILDDEWEMQEYTDTNLVQTYWTGEMGNGLEFINVAQAIEILGRRK